MVDQPFKQASASENRHVELIDTHCHLDVDDFAADRLDVLARCQQLGIRRLIVPAVTRATWDALLHLCDNQTALYPALGLHPVYIDQHSSRDLDDLILYAQQHQLVAIGEIGLDFFLKELDVIKQQRFFDAQLAIAEQADLPVILHVRKAHDEVLRMLKAHTVRGGIVHAFNGSLQQAEQYIALGLKLGFGGMLTYERSTKLRQLARDLPIESIVLETDAPDMTVASHRGERNSPEYLIDCLTSLAELRQLEPEEVARQTTLNASAVLRL